MSQVVDDNQDVVVRVKRREVQVLLNLIRIRQDEHRHLLGAMGRKNSKRSTYEALDIELEKLKMNIAGQI